MINQSWMKVKQCKTNNPLVKAALNALNKLHSNNATRLNQTVTPKDNFIEMDMIQTCNKTSVKWLEHVKVKDNI